MTFTLAVRLAIFFVNISIKVALCAKIENIPFKRLNLKSKNIPLLY